MHREQHLIIQIIQKLNLNLNGLTLLTEVGSNNYIYTPIIALMAGAEKVYAWTKDTDYGRGEQIISNCINLCEQYNIDLSKIEFSNNERPKEHIKNADVITNLGFVRPLNNEFLKYLKKTAVISYMCESWEYREGDIDLVFCKNHGIKVAGTWENRDDLKIFDAVGYLTAKMCFEAGFEIYQNNILIISNDHFGVSILNSFTQMKASNVSICNPKDINFEKFKDIDFIVLADYTTELNIFNSAFLKWLSFNNVGIIHLSGILDYKILKELGISVYPKKDGTVKRMTYTLAHLGPKPVIDLHAAGLKVGEELSKNNISSLSQILC